MSAYIDCELKARDADTGESIIVYLTGETGHQSCWVEHGDTCLELDARDLRAALAYAEFIDG